MDYWWKRIDEEKNNNSTNSFCAFLWIPLLSVFYCIIPLITLCNSIRSSYQIEYSLTFGKTTTSTFIFIHKYKRIRLWIGEFKRSMNSLPCTLFVIYRGKDYQSILVHSQRNGLRLVFHPHTQEGLKAKFNFLLNYIEAQRPHTH